MNISFYLWTSPLLQNICFLGCACPTQGKIPQSQISSRLLPVSFLWSFLVIFATVCDSVWEHFRFIQLYPTHKHILLFFPPTISDTDYPNSWYDFLFRRARVKFTVKGCSFGYSSSPFSLPCFKTSDAVDTLPAITYRSP